MKMKLLYLGLIFGCSSLFAMEMPEAHKNVIEENLETALKNFPELYSQREEIKKSIKFEQEEAKFKKYHLENTEKFIKYLRKIFLKPTLRSNPYLIYLGNLQLVSMALWYQHF